MPQFDTVRRIVGPTILLASGNYFDYCAPETSVFTIDDIAHGLSMTCRFAGQCARFYSVAEHSIYVSQLVPPEDALTGLLHDAAEAFVGDMAKPLKVLLPEYKAIENRVEKAIFDRFGLPFPLPASIKPVDVRMLATEQRQVMRNRDDWDYTRGMAPADITIRCLPPADAKREFLERFHAIANEGCRP